MADYYYTDASRQPAGPVPLEELRAMHERGELAPDALVAEVGADAWTPIAELFGQPAPGGDGAWAPGGVGTTPPMAPTGPIRATENRFEPLAGWAFGLGMASWVCAGVFAAIPGVILGHMALSRIKATGNTDGASKVLAIIGLIASYLSVGFLVVALLIGLSFGLLGAMGP
ncbi:MAG: GYF domain-containing protein [Phycisphaerales bacterium JB060]